MPWNGDKTYVTITRKVTGFSERPWTIGAYYARGEIGDEVMRAWQSAAVGIGGTRLRRLRGDPAGKAPVAARCRRLQVMHSALRTSTLTASRHYREAASLSWTTRHLPSMPC